VTTTAPERSEVVEFDPIRDKTYRRARLGPDVAAFLAWLELGGASPITVDNYERALAVVCRMYPNTPIDEITDGQLAQVFKRFPARSRRVRVAPYRTFFKWARQTRRVTENPMELLPLIRRQPRKRPDVFTDAEVDALLSLDVVDAAPLASSSTPASAAPSPAHPASPLLARLRQREGDRREGRQGPGHPA
jgi:integrase